MYEIPLNELKEKIISSGKLNEEELNNKITSKISELSGLISEEGAAHIIANELNLKLVPETLKNLKIKEIYAGMKNISTVGKVIRKYEVREFAKEDRTGKVCSLILGDETGTVRVVFWNEQVDQLDNVNENTILEIKEAYVRENNNNKEIHLGNKGSIKVNPENVTIEVKSTSEFKRTTIKELTTNQDNIEILGTVIQVFDPRFFEVHPETGRRLREAEPGITPAISYVLNAVVDDGTGNIRCVFWKNQTDHLIPEQNVADFQQNQAGFEEIKTDLLGEQFKLKGRVQKNEMFDRLELNVQLVEKAKAEEELQLLEKQ